MSTEPHATVPVPVWADVDVGIADLVRWLNSIPGVRTFSSCQGTIGEGGPVPYPPHVSVTWADDKALAAIRTRCVLALAGGRDHWGDAIPLTTLAAVEEGTK